MAIQFQVERFRSDELLKGRFLREARAAARRNSPRVIVMDPMGDEQGRPYLVLKFAAGQTASHVATMVASINEGRQHEEN